MGRKELLRNVLSVTLALILAVPSGMTVNAETDSVAVLSEEVTLNDESVLGQALAVYDFENGTESLNREGEKYLKVENEEAVMENGDYVYEVSTALPEVKEDEEKGKVLEFKDSVRVNKYETAEGDVIQQEEKVGGRVKLVNPFKGMTFAEDDTSAGISISYWVKVPVIQVDENGNKVTDGTGTDRGANSTTVVFNNSGRTVINKEDYVKYLACQAYDKAVLESDEETLQDYDMGTQKIVKDADGNAYVLYENYGKLLRFNPNYPDTAAVSQAAAAVAGTAGVAKNGGWYVPADSTKGKITVTDEAGNTYKISSLAGSGTTIQDENQYELFAYRYAQTDDKENGYSSKSMVREGSIDGSLQISTDNDFGFREDSYREEAFTDEDGLIYKKAVNGTKVTNPNCAQFGTIQELRRYNQFYFDGDEFATDVDTAAEEWHYVTVVIQNDWVVTYVDGVAADPEVDYQFMKETAGLTGSQHDFGVNNTGKMFNKGKGLRGIFGLGESNVKEWSEDGTASTSPVNGVAITMLDWIADENTELYLGGTGFASEALAQGYGTVEGVCLDDVAFFGTALTEDEAVLLYEEAQDLLGSDLIGDANEDEMIGLDDVEIALKSALKIIAPEVAIEIFDIDQNNKVELSDAQSILDAVLGVRVIGDGNYDVKCMDSIPDVSLEKFEENGQLICNIIVDNTDVQMFDYGISYDSSKLRLKSLDWDSVIYENITLKCFKQLGNNFVVLGGVSEKPYKYYTGAIGRLVFEVIGNDEGEISIVPNSANANVEIDKVAEGIEAGVAVDIHGAHAIKPSITATSLEDRKIQVTIKLSGNDEDFDIGLMYDKSQVRLTDYELDATTLNSLIKNDWVVAKEHYSEHEYWVVAGVGLSKVELQDVTIASVTFELLDEVFNADFSVCMDSGIYIEFFEKEDQPMREIAPAMDSCSVTLEEQKQQPQITTTVDQFQNEDGTVTERITETTIEIDGTIVEKITETTTDSENLPLLIVETVIITKKQSDGSLINKTTTKILEKADDVTVMVEDDMVVDVIKDASGTGVEIYKYKTGMLPLDVEWSTELVKEPAEADITVLKAKGAKEYELYNIVAKSNGNIIEVTQDSVKVSLYCGDKWNGKNIKVFDFQANEWLEAVLEGEYISFYAEHFNKFAIAEVITVKKGDVDLDNKITLQDAQTTLKAALNIEQLEGDGNTAGDVDEDGKITLQDAQMILKAALNIIKL